MAYINIVISVIILEHSSILIVVNICLWSNAHIPYKPSTAADQLKVVVIINIVVMIRLI